MARILVACEESQAVCIEFRKRGHEAFSCDLQECSGGHPEWHFVCSVFDLLDPNLIAHNTQGGAYVEIKGWDLMVAHPPCTYLSNAGNGYFDILKYGDKAIQRWRDRIEAVDFFMKLINAPIPRIAVENPVGFINSFMKPTQTIHPNYFGDPDKKRTCLWLKNLPPLQHLAETDLFGAATHVEAKPTYVNKSGKALYFTDSISGSTKDTHRLRSKTFPGIARAIAEQWSACL